MKEMSKKQSYLKNKKEKGITLIALVITIIVLLILAGISIAMLTGDNGVLTKATESKNETTQATAEEMVKLAIGSLQTKNLGDRSQITPDAIANQVMEDNDIENVTAEGSEFPTNIVFADDGIKVGVNLDFEVGEISSYDGIYSEPGLEGKIAPADLFDYEIIDDGAISATGMDSLPEKTVRITRIKPQYANGGGYNPDTKEHDLEDTNYGIKYDNDVITQESLLVIPYQVDGKYIPNGIEGELYKVTEVNIFVYGYSIDRGNEFFDYTLPENMEIIIFPNTIERMNGYGTGKYNENLKKVVLSNQLKNIPESTFEDCVSLENITIPESVTSIGIYAFSGTMWYEKQYESCIYINNILYEYNGWIEEESELNIREGTIYINEDAVRNEYRLSSLTLPDSVKVIGKSAFYGCGSLKTVVYKGTNYTSVSELVETLESNGVTVEETSFSNTGLSA